MRAALLFLLGLAAAARAANPIVPADTTAERYRPIWVRSPFTVATAAQEKNATWVLTGFAQNGKDPLVFLQNREDQSRMTVGLTPNEKGFVIEAINSNSDPLLSTVKVKTPAETLTLRFDPAQLTAPPLASPSPAGSGPMTSAPPRLPGRPPFANPQRGMPQGQPFRQAPPMQRPPAARTSIPNPIAPNTQPPASTP